MTIHDYTQLYIAIHSYKQLYMAIHGYTQLNMIIEGYKQLYIAIHSYRYTQLYMAIHGDIWLFNNYSTRARWISNVIIQQIATMPIYGKEALNICHPT